MQQAPHPPQEIWSSLTAGRAIEASATPTGEAWLPQDARPLPVRDWDSLAPRRNWLPLIALAALAATAFLLLWLCL